MSPSSAQTGHALLHGPVSAPLSPFRDLRSSPFSPRARPKDNGSGCVCKHPNVSASSQSASPSPPALGRAKAPGKKATYPGRKTEPRGKVSSLPVTPGKVSLAPAGNGGQGQSVSSDLEPNHVLGPCRTLPKLPVAFGFQECPVSCGQVEGEATFLSFFHLPKLNTPASTESQVY